MVIYTGTNFTINMNTSSTPEVFSVVLYIYSDTNFNSNMETMFTFSKRRAIYSYLTLNKAKISNGNFYFYFFPIL